MELFTRLTSNLNQWVTPSGHSWKKSNQGKRNIPYEKQFGFGHEEWLFNFRYSSKGYQYGFIRGLSRFSKSDNIDKVYLYTVKEMNGSKQVYYLGFLKNVEILPSNWREIYPHIIQKFLDYKKAVIDEVEQTNGDINGLLKDELIPVIRFKLSDINLFDRPRFLEKFPLTRYKRFQPYVLTETIKRIFENISDANFNEESYFIPGKSKQKGTYSKFIDRQEKSITPLHSEIIENLENFLKPNFSIRLKNISIEKTIFRGNIADVVLEYRNRTYCIYEIKTSPSARKNIRDAIGQLLDYALNSGNMKIKKLVIVSPKSGKDNELAFFNSLKKIISFDLEYLIYDDDLPEKFNQF
jgi:hypothetical protein